MEYITNTRGEQVTLDEFITWSGRKQQNWSQHGHSDRLTPEQREKISEAAKLRWASKTPEQREAIGKKISLIKKQRNTCANRTPEEREAIRQNYSEAAKLRWASKTPKQREAIKQKTRKTKQATRARKMVDQKIN